MNRFAASVFLHLEEADIEYCLLRGLDRPEMLEAKVEIDLLVRPDQLDRLRTALGQIGFVHLRVLGHAPHHFFVAYDEREDTWLKLDVVTALAYGRPYRTLQVALVEHCLVHRRCKARVFVLSPEYELITLLLHCLLDEAHFKPESWTRLAELRGEIADESRMARLLALFVGPGLRWPEVASAIESEDWKSLVLRRPQVVRELRRQAPLRAVWLALSGRALRRLNSIARPFRQRGFAVALLAPDGGGKTTLARELVRTFYLPSRYIYAGSSVDKRNIALPSTRWLQARKEGAGSKQGALSSESWRLLRYGNGLLDRWYQSVIGSYYLLRGRLVIFDRYRYDSLLQSGQRSFPRRLRSWLISRMSISLNLVVYLDAPGEVLYQRKREHSVEFLERQRSGYLGLQGRIPDMVVVDATQDLGDVRRRVTSAIWAGYCSREWSE